MEVALRTIRTPVIHKPDNNVYELDIAPAYYRNGAFNGLEARFVQCSNWHTSRIEEKSLVVQRALQGACELSFFELADAKLAMERLVVNNVDIKIASYAKAGIILRLEDFPMYRAAKSSLDNAREKAILAKDYYEMLKGGCSVTFINAIHGPLRLALEGNLEKG